MHGRNPVRREVPNGVGTLRCVFAPERMGKARGYSPPPTMICPNECAIARVEFFDAVLLLDHLRTVHSESSFARHNDVACEPCSERHSSEAADRAGGETDHRSMFSQCQNGGHELGDYRQAKIRLLKTHTTRLEQNHCAGPYALLVIGTGPIEGGSHLCAGHLSAAPGVAGRCRALPRRR